MDYRENGETPAWLEDIGAHLDQILEDLENEEAELNLVICDNEFIKNLNHQYRHKDYATDVLSFPAQESEEDDLDFVLEQDPGLGDIILSLEKAEAQAREYGVSLEEETARLAIHGCLHLLGYDHETSVEDEKIMFDIQDDYLERYLENKKTSH